MEVVGLRFEVDHSHCLILARIIRIRPANPLDTVVLLRLVQNLNPSYAQNAGLTACESHVSHVWTISVVQDPRERRCVLESQFVTEV